MSLSDETVFSKLNALNDTQEGIVSIAQWVMFHRRHAKKFAELWLIRLKDSSASRKLNLIYLVNEVVQQMKMRKKEDFSQAFSPIIIDACEVTYKSSPSDIQQKLRRVVDVWKQRSIFDNEVLNGIATRLDDLDKGKSTTGGRGRLGGLGNSSGSIPSELARVVAAQQKLTSKLTLSAIHFGTAGTEYTKQMEAEAIPSPPVYAARLSTLLKTLDTASVAVKDAMSSRSELIKTLEGLLETNKTALEGERAQLKEIEVKRGKTDEMKKDVEHMILSGLNGNEENHPMEGGNGGDSKIRSTTPDMQTPEVEALTPPIQPVGNEPSHPFSYSQSPTLPPGSDLLASMMSYGGLGLAKPQVQKAADNPMAGMEGLDADLVAMFKQEQAGVDARANGGGGTGSGGGMRVDDDDEYRP